MSSATGNNSTEHIRLHEGQGDVPALFAHHHPRLQAVGLKVVHGQRITEADALLLYQQADLALLALLASTVAQRLNGNNVLYNKNFHIEPTNLCRYSCRFCSYHKAGHDPQCWTLTLAEIEQLARRYAHSDVTEAHIVGGVHPQWGLDEYCSIVRTVRTALPGVHIKAFSAVELHYIFDREGITPHDGLARLQREGLNSIPGGGAEIFAPEIRQQICPEKASPEQWLAVHEAAHRLGISSNATMLYGHIERYEHRVAHMAAIRALQDKTGGFNCFIPLKYRAAGNPMGHLGEVPLSEDLRNYAVSRIFMDNLAHLKAYWPMLGMAHLPLAIAFGADDIDGTIDDTTKIYSMAGAQDQTVRLTVSALRDIARRAGKNPVERDSLYRHIAQ